MHGALLLHRGHAAAPTIAPRVVTSLHRPKVTDVTRSCRTYTRLTPPSQAVAEAQVRSCARAPCQHASAIDELDPLCAAALAPSNSTRTTEKEDGSTASPEHQGLAAFDVERQKGGTAHSVIVHHACQRRARHLDASRCGAVGTLSEGCGRARVEACSCGPAVSHLHRATAATRCAPALTSSRTYRASSPTAELGGDDVSRGTPHSAQARV